MFKLSTLFVEIKANDDALRKQTEGVRSQLTGMGVAIGTAVGSLAAGAISSAASALTGFISRGIAGASNLGESLSKVDAVFGQFGSTITGTADQLAKDFGLSKQSILDAGAAVGLIAKGAGYSQEAAAGMGSQMAKLAADAASFYNVPLDEALNKIRAGLVGESEPLRAFGVMLSEEAVAAEAVALGLARTTKEVDNQAKVAARASLITKGLHDATGDLARTADSTSNQWRKFTGQIENLTVEIGTAFLPACNEIINVATQMMSSLKTAFTAGEGAFGSFVAGVTEGARTIAVMWRNLPDIWEIVRLSAIQMAQNIVAAIATIPENAAIIGEYLANNWVKLIQDGANAVIAILTNLGNNIYELGRAIAEFLSDPTKGFHVNFTPLLDGFKATADALPELVKPKLDQMQGEIDAVAERIAKRESDRAAAAADKAKATKGIAAAAEAAAAGKAAEFKSSSTGIADFAGKLRESIFSAKDESAKKTAEATQRTAKASEESRDLLKKGIPAVLS